MSNYLSGIFIECAGILLASSHHPGDRDFIVESDLYHATDFTAENEFTSGIEGPAFIDGILYAVNFNTQGTIGMVDPDGHCALFVNLPEGSIGNGIRIDSEGDLFIADYTKHNVLRIDRQRKSIEVYAHNDSMNQPKRSGYQK